MSGTRGWGNGNGNEMQLRGHQKCAKKRTQNLGHGEGVKSAMSSNCPISPFQFSNVKNTDQPLRWVCT